MVLIGFLCVFGIKLADELQTGNLPLTQTRAEVLNQVHETTAAPGYRPSDIASGQQNRFLRMRANNVGLLQMLSQTNWFYFSAASFSGVYGYMNIFPPRPFLLLQWTVFILAVGSLVITAWHLQAVKCRAPWLGILTVGLITVLAASAGFSWVVDYQPQGRYLLSVLPILGLALAPFGASLTKSLIPRFTLTVSFLVSATSFWLICVSQLPRNPFWL